MLGILTIFGREVSSYSVCAGIGVLMVLLVLPRFAEERGVGGHIVSDVFLWCAPLAVVGAVLLYGLTNASTLGCVFSLLAEGRVPFSEALSVVIGCFGGMVFYGGAMGSVWGLSLWLRRHVGCSRDDVCDLFALAVPLFHAFARVGCFLGGCCYGVEFSPGIDLVRSPVPGVAGVERFPVQLVEAGAEALLFLVLLRLYRARRWRGELLWVWVGLYAPMRFALEFFRGDVFRGFLGPLSTSQWVSAILVAIALMHFRFPWVERLRTSG